MDAVNGIALTKPSRTRGGNFELYRTHNAGATWNRVGTAPSSIDLVFLDEDHAWAHESSESFDGGENWLPRNNLVPAPEIVDATPKTINTPGRLFFLNDRYGWLQTNFFDPDNFFQRTARFLRTQDGGATWEVMSTQVTENSYDFFFIDENNGFRFVDGTFASLTIDRTTDGGATWEPAYTGDEGDIRWEIESLFAPDTTTGWAVGDSGVAMTQVEGATDWEVVSFPEEWVLQDVEYNKCTGGLMVGGETQVDGPVVILKSTDEHFSMADRVSIPLGPHELRAIEIPSSGSVYVYGGYGLGLRYAGPTNALGIATASLAMGQEGAAYSQSLAAVNGSDPLSWEICSGDLPEGVSFSAAGEFSGTPTEGGDFPIVVAVADSTEQTASRKYTLRILPVTLPTIQPQTLPNGAVGVPYAAELQASGTVVPYSFRLKGGQLPSGFNLARIGFLGGTTQLPGTYEFEVEVQDGQSPRGRTRITYSLTIEGEVGPGDPCDDAPLFCLASEWLATGSGLSSDRTGDQEVDAFDVLMILNSLR